MLEDQRRLVQTRSVSKFLLHCDKADTLPDGYDLPPTLRDFLFTKASQRNFPSLQVVFGRGNEFFASDANEKLEFKEPEPEKKEASPQELEERRALRRSRTLSFLRPRSEESRGFLDQEAQSPASSRRSSLINGRPPSALSFRSNSDASLHTLNPSPESRPQSVSHTRFSSDSSVTSQLGSRESSARTSVSSRPASDSAMSVPEEMGEGPEKDRPLGAPSIAPAVQSTKRLRPLSMSFKAGLIPRIPEGRQVPQEKVKSPAPPVPALPQSVPGNTPAKLWSASKSPESSGIRPLQTKQVAKGQAPDTRSISPPFQMSEEEQDGSPTLSDEPERIFSRETDVRTPPPPVPTHTLPRRADNIENSQSTPTLSIQTIPIALQTTPISAQAPSPLSLQIITTAVQTAPKPPTTPQMHPHRLSFTLSTLSTSPASPLRLKTAPFYPPDPQKDISTSPSSDDAQTPQDNEPSYLNHDYAWPYHQDPPPIKMGHMMSYYSRPGYQLGQSLFGGYEYGYGVQKVFVEGYTDGDGESGLTEWERANGVGY